MATVTADMITITPDTYSKVEVDAAEIAAVVGEVRGRIAAVPDDLPVVLEIDEDQPTTRMSITSLDPLVFAVESGCLEDTRKPRHFGVEMASVSLAALFIEYLDRIDPDFGAPPLGEPSDFAQKVAWSASIHGRVAREGYRVHRPKHRYNFRNRHGFSDAADEAFDALWSLPNPTWAGIMAICSRSD